MTKKPQLNHVKTASKLDIVNELYSGIGYSKKYSAELVEFCFDVIKKQLSLNRNVKISGFGHFVLKNKKARLGRDPTTGKKITIPKRKVVSFRVSALLREKIQQ